MIRYIEIIFDLYIETLKLGRESNRLKNSDAIYPKNHLIDLTSYSHRLGFGTYVLISYRLFTITISVRLGRQTPLYYNMLPIDRDDLALSSRITSRLSRTLSFRAIN